MHIPPPPPIGHRPIHFAVDIETLGLRADSVIMSVGVVAFTVAGGEVSSLYEVMSTRQQAEEGRFIDPDTVSWWERQSPAARAVVSESMECQTPLAQSLDRIEQFFAAFNTGSYSHAGVWGYGADFDNSFLQHLFLSMGRKVPYDWRKNRCGRTLVHLAGLPPPTQIVGVHHHALDDARFQAAWFRSCIAKIDNSLNPVIRPN